MPETNNAFKRDTFIREVQRDPLWDMVIIGGGATGLGIALDAASRGFKTLLLEQSDFAKGTSSRSTKLVHGGVRYLAQGDLALVREALRERGLLLENAPHLVKKQAFIIPCFDFFSKMKYLVGLKLYDWLSGRYSFGRSRPLSKTSVMQQIPDIQGKRLQGGVEYFDGQFDDARLAVDLAITAASHGAGLINYMQVNGLTKDSSGKIEGVTARDLESGSDYTIRAKMVINATGVFADEILQMDHPEGKARIRPSQGIHLVLDKSFWRGNKALMIPKTSDGRVLFGVPWHDYLLLGTTDTPLDKHSLEPVALDKEIAFILKTAGQYLSKTPGKKDILSVYAGLRPLAAPDKETGSTKEISRSHKIYIEPSRLMTITGGKWTTYRKMAEDVVDKAIRVGQLEKVPCKTYHLRIKDGLLSGTDQDASSTEFLASGENFQITEAGVRHAVRFEMARTVEDVLARRYRILFLDAQAALDLAPLVAPIIADELGYNEAWQHDQLLQFTQLVKPYLIDSHGKVHSHV
jgi:glycerol-3-phosphate dehydrogenase